MKIKDVELNGIMIKNVPYNDYGLLAHESIKRLNNAYKTAKRKGMSQIDF